MITIQKNQLADFRWLARSLSTDKNRPVLMLFHVADKDTIVTCDGCRVHILTLENHGIPEGNYSMASKSPMILAPVADLKFPDWKIVVPDQSKMHKQSACRRHEVAARFGMLGGVLDMDKVTDAFAWGNGSDSMDFYTSDSMSPVVIQDATHKVILMPMRGFDIKPKVTQ